MRANLNVPNGSCYRLGSTDGLKLFLVVALSLRSALRAALASALRAALASALVLDLVYELATDHRPHWAANGAGTNHTITWLEWFRFFPRPWGCVCGWVHPLGVEYGPLIRQFGVLWLHAFSTQAR